MTKYKKEVIDLMLTDPILYGKMAVAMGVQPGSLDILIRRNGKNIQRYSVVTMVAEYMGKHPDELFETINEPA